ncbi:MAG TPA: Crp/Fnr family transcriptional regulator [Chryseosolibacter sp.]
MEQSSPFAAFKKFIDLTGPISDDAWVLLAKILERKQVKKGELTLQEGQVCRFIDFIETGSFRMFYNKDGAEFTTGLFTEGLCLTNMKSLSQETASELNLEANETAVITRFYKDKLIGLYARSPELQALGRKVLESMVIYENSWKEMYTLYDPAERYEFLVRKSPETVLRFPMQHLASFLGIRRETLSRIRSRSKTNARSEKTS